MSVAHNCACCSAPAGSSAPVASSAPPYNKGLTKEQKHQIYVLIFCALIFTLTMIFETELADSLGFWTIGLLYALPYLLCGVPVFKSALVGLRSKDYFNEFTLMGIATLAAILLGHLAEAVGVMLFYSIGEFLQDLATQNSRGSIRALLASRPSLANVLENGAMRVTPVEEVEPGARLVIRAGEKIPLDGLVLSGCSQIDSSPLTGESMPSSVGAGDKVNAGCINLQGVLEIETTSRFADTHMARILELVEHAMSRKSPTERFITRFAHYYTPVVVLLALLVAMLPPLLWDEAFSAWIYRALVLLVISCPCALLISVPLGYFGGIGLASHRGILVKGGNVLDGILKTRAVIFDKTGTLTEGRFSVTAQVPAQGFGTEELLQAAALAECESNHPIALSIMKKTAGFKRPTELKIKEIAGQGMVASCSESGAEDTYYAGNTLLMQNLGLAAPIVDEPGSVVYVAKNKQYLGYLLVSDSLKADAAEAVAALKARGLKTTLFSGDRTAVVAFVADKLKMDSFRAELLPGHKVEAMESIGQAREIAFVGDGINDAPGLALAGVGIAMGGIGSAAAIEAADVVILNDSPLKVVELYTIAEVVQKVVRQNIAFSLGIKIMVMGFGLTGLSGLWEAVFADVGVALLAVLNVVRSLRKKS
ncbi:MAG: heavy metal translocating P-type ATPase [Deltaproteobacteria bacterium]|jgi:Cd2+/Zn2+-exporting ATPase|nr:heavy metal translocating P-type ATPase [Deltaproteobacteria bacterium]